MKKKKKKEMQEGERVSRMSKGMQIQDVREDVDGGK